MSVPFPMDIRLCRPFLLYYDIDIIKSSRPGDPASRVRSAPRYHLVVGNLGLVVDDLRREPLAQHPHPAGLLEAADDIRRELPPAVAARAVPQHAEHQR